MDAVTAKLGMSTDDLTSSPASGQSMTQLAQKAGLSKDDLVSTTASTLSSTGADGQPVDPHPAGHPHRRPHPPGREPPRARAGVRRRERFGGRQGIDALSSALGISSDDLMQRLTDGTGIADPLNGDSGVAAQLSASQNKGALVDGWA